MPVKRRVLMSEPESVAGRVSALRERLGLTRSRFFTPDIPSVLARLCLALAICSAAIYAYDLYRSLFGLEPYLLFGIGAVVFSAWLGRLLGGLAAAVTWLFVTPGILGGVLGERALVTASDPWALVLFAFEATAIGLLVEGLHTARRAGLAGAAERQTLAEDLLVERNRLELLLANLPGLVWEMRTDPGEPRSPIRFASANALRLSGYIAQDWAGTDLLWKSLVPTDEQEDFAAEISAAIRGGSRTFRHHWRHADGTLRAFETHLTAQPSRDGRYHDVRGVSLDVTALDSAERALAETERHFRTVSDRAPILIRLFHPDRGTIWCNRAWLELRGRTLEEERGAGWLQGVHPEDREHVASTLAAASAALEEYRVEYRLRRADGSFRWMLSVGVPRTDARGDYQDYLGFCFDIDEHKHLEFQREDLLRAMDLARKEAELATRSKDEFLAKVSHELRNPLNGILGWTQILGAPETTEEELRTGITRIDSSARTLARLVDDLLDLSRILSGKFSLSLAPARLGPVLEAALEQLQPAAAAKGVELELVVAGELPPVLADATRLQQVFCNLLSNAVKFTPRGGHVWMEVSRESSTVVVKVSDDGSGIDPEFLPHVFSPFRQADGRAARRHQGLGLGLSIVAQLVERHGGTVQATSEGVDRGTTLLVRLPLSPVHGAERREPHEVEIRLDDRQVLVVDDDQIAREMLRTVLTRSGAQVREAASAGEALAAIASAPPDVLVSDLEMPGEDGLSLVRRVRSLSVEAGGETPAIALTAYTRPADRPAALAAGFQDHLAKPVDTRELLAAIERLAGR